jgi:hypothetical protein
MSPHGSSRSLQYPQRGKPASLYATNRLRIPYLIAFGDGARLLSFALTKKKP